MANQTVFKNTIFRIGDTVKVHHKIKEVVKDKEKIKTQIFQGIVIAIKGKKEGKSLTVRKIGASAIGVERIWPLGCPSLSKIEVVKRGKVRRAKLYYLRRRAGKKATRLREFKGEVKSLEISEEEALEQKVEQKTEKTKTKNKVKKIKKDTKNQKEASSKKETPKAPNKEDSTDKK